MGAQFRKVPKLVHHFKACRTKGDVKMFLTGEIKNRMSCDWLVQMSDFGRKKKAMTARHLAEVYPLKCVSEWLDQLS